jgi:flagellar capping protein FliD
MGSWLMATFNKFNSFVEALAEKVHKLDTDVLKVALSNSAPVATNTVLANITQIANGNGYTTGGAQASQVSSQQTSGTYKLVLNDVTFTATPGGIGPFQYVVLYNDTATNDELIGWYDYGTALTVTAGNSFTVDFDATNGVLTIA